MDKKFYQEEFEQFLQDEVKQHRMYPSDHIWKNIRTELHGYKAWPALTFISLFIITALTISTLLNNHPERHFTAPVNTSQQILANRSAGNPANAAPVKENDYFQQIAPEQLTAETFAGLTETAPQETLVVRNSSNDFAAVPLKTNYSSEHTERSVSKTLTAHKAGATAFTIENTLVAPTVTEENTITETAKTSESVASPVAENKNPEIHSTADDFLKDFKFVSVTPQPRRNSKFGYQFYITPSTSYRILSDQKVKEIIQPSMAATSASSAPLSINASADVNNVVRHKPALGYELGFALLYNMSGRLKFKTGLQLNVRQYYIETFQSLTNDLTSLSLINYRGVETISFYSAYNNNTGYRKMQLDNQVYQLSVPLGLQWDVIQGKHLGINTEASVQPTFTLNNNTYLLSTDYKHYTGGDEFLRKWNINTSVGINLTYKTGSGSFQLGPQIRYQHLPTYSNLYPIKEYLVDYGIRLGYTHQIK